MNMKRLVSTAIAAIFLTVAGIASAAPVEGWTTDPNTGGKICIVFSYEGATLLSASWSGPVVDGNADGKGLLKYVFKDDDGKEIKGQADSEMKAGKLNGKVSFTWSDGASFDGYYKEGLAEGKGKKKYASGSVYDGDWKNGLPNGKGVLKNDDGRIFDGDWKDGYLDGKVTLTWPSGQTYVGDYKKGQRDGYGVVKNAAGAVIYSGEWKNDKPVKKAD